MRGFVAVLQREILERRLLALLALGLGLTAVALPLMPGIRPGDITVSDLQGGIALGFALILTVLLALFLGGSIVATDLAERRLGFYFARPLPGWAVWAGKMAAALALILGGGLLVLAPAVLLGGSLGLDGNWGIGNLPTVSGVSFVVTWILALLFLLLTAHVLSVIVRARSAWAMLDLAALALISGLLWTALQRLRLEGVLVRAGVWSRADRLGIVVWMELGLAVVILLALVVASALQVIRGRTDLRRAHRVLSLGLWGILLTAVLLFAGLTFWVLAAGPGDLEGFSIVSAAPAAPAGHWIAFAGPARRRPGYFPSFLYDLDSGRSVRARFGLVSFYNIYDRAARLVRFSADGKRAVWLEYDGNPFNSPVVAFRLDLDRPGSKPVRTPISLGYPPRGFALSADGRRMAVYEWQGRLTVAAVDDGRLLAVIKYESPSTAPLLAFAGPDHLRVYEFGVPEFFSRSPNPEALAISELDLMASPSRLTATGQLPALAGVREWTLSPGADRILLRSKDSLQLCDARTGTSLALLGDGRARASFLPGGRIAVTAPAAGGRELRIFPADGSSPARRIPFPGARTLIAVDPPVPGQVRVVTTRAGVPATSRELWQVDLESGLVRSLGTRRLAELKLPELARGPVDFAGKDGVIWLEPWAARERVALKGR